MRYHVLASLALAAACAACGEQAPTRPSPAAPIPLPAPPPSSHEYTVTFTADDACTALPPAARTRTYTAFIAEAINDHASLKGATFAGPDASGYPGFGLSWNILVFDGRAEEKVVFFSDPPILELPSADTHVMIEGRAQGRMGDTTTVLGVDGWFSYCSSTKPGGHECAVTRVTCRSSKHTLMLTRR